MNYILYLGLALKEDELDILKSNRLPERCYDYYEPICYNKKGLLDLTNDEIIKFDNKSIERAKNKDVKLKGIVAYNNEMDAANAILEFIKKSSESPTVPRELVELYGEEKAIEMKMLMAPYTYGYKFLHPCIIKYEVDSKAVLLNPYPFIEGMFDRGNNWEPDFENELCNLFGKESIEEYKKYKDRDLGYKVLSSVFANDKNVIKNAYQNKTILMPSYLHTIPVLSSFIVKGEIGTNGTTDYTDYYGSSMKDLINSERPRKYVERNGLIKMI